MTTMVERLSLEVSPLSKLERILDCDFRPTATDEPDVESGVPKKSFVKQYLVKYKDVSYLHCFWVPEHVFVKAYASNPQLKIRVKKFHQHKEAATKNGEDFIAIPFEWTTVDRIIDSRFSDQREDEWKEYLVKYKGLSYDECYWESESDISTFQNEIQRFKDINSAPCRGQYVERERNHEIFKPFDQTPEFLTGTLHPYQLEGLNFLRFSWSKGRHVILADEMGLGKTIQSIAFLASLFEEYMSPYLVVAPLSTLRNWEREFAIWAPHMNVIMYSGTSQARTVIRDHEFYFPKVQVRGESKHERIKFDVLLASYEVINADKTYLKPIKWKCMIVDKGGRLEKKDLKFFSLLKQYPSEHRILLTGKSLQNNLDELFVLMHFLDVGKFGSLEEFQEEFKDINQEEQISKLHNVLAPHFLRRTKKDVLKEMPPKKELILRVDLTFQQKKLYKTVITRNYKTLVGRGGAKVSNVLMKLQKVCLHPYMLDGVEPDIQDQSEAFRQLLKCSVKLQLVDKMMAKLKEQGHRVLIYTQFQRMLDLLEDYFNYKDWYYERIDGNVCGAERKIRIDRFNAENSNRFCFLLSTRAGGVGINLARANTIIIYDSDWNPHADLQAIARVHQLGQINKVMIYRLISRGTVEEKMLQMAKLSQEELHDIIRYGSKETFSENNEETGKIHYDDDAIDKLLVRDHVEAEEVSVNIEEEYGCQKAFKESETAIEVAQGSENKSFDQAKYWESLLQDKYEIYHAEEPNALGKRKRSSKQMSKVENRLDGPDLSSGESYEFEPSDGEVGLYRKRRTCGNSETIPSIQNQGKYSGVLGFNQGERATFLKTLMRFGVGDDDWSKFVHPLKPKTLAEIKDYGILFLKHVHENTEDTSPTYSDGVLKENVNSAEVLGRITLLKRIKEKVKFIEDNPVEPLFPSRLRPLRGEQFWKEEHDKILLRAIIKHGYSKWQNIVNDKELGIQEIICKQRGIPYISENHSAHGGQMDSKEVKLIKRKFPDFVRARVLLLEEALSDEYAQACCRQGPGQSSVSAEQVEAVKNVVDTDNEMSRLEPIVREETDQDAEMENVVQKWTPGGSDFIDLTLTDAEEEAANEVAEVIVLD